MDCLNPFNKSAECPRSLCQFLTLRGRILESSVSSALKFIDLRAEGSKLELQRLESSRRPTCIAHGK